MYENTHVSGKTNNGTLNKAVIRRALNSKEFSEAQELNHQTSKGSLAMWFKIFPILAFTLFVSPALADNDGPGTGGGGNDIEAKFRGSVEAVLDSIDRMRVEARKHLTFDPYQLRASLLSRNGLRPACARGQRLEQLVAEEKMAMVFADAPSTVSLDCRSETIPRWQQLFNSKKMEDKVLFLHEALRVSRREGEDDYSKSGSFLKAISVDTQLDRRDALKIFQASKDARCHVIFWFPGTTYETLEIRVDGKAVLAHQRPYSYTGDSESMKSDILFGSGVVFNHGRTLINAKFVSSLGHAFGCFSDRASVANPWDPNAQIASSQGSKRGISKKESSRLTKDLSAGVVASAPAHEGSAGRGE
ncbi:MAG: hypothetical protein NDJ89_06255 [Oligoflexia bacterium]|nr:hypothetical protein [Oligoflexia bacterium]